MSCVAPKFMLVAVLLWLPAKHAGATTPQPSPIAWEPSLSELVVLVSEPVGVPSEHASVADGWRPSDISVTYSFRADGDSDSARSRTDAFDDLLAPDGVDLRWSEGRSSSEVHYVTLKLDWDFDSRREGDAKRRSESETAAAKRRASLVEDRHKAIDLYVERRGIQGELLGKDLSIEQVWAKSARLTAINAELDLLTSGRWRARLTERRPPSAPAWLSGLDAD